MKNIITTTSAIVALTLSSNAWAQSINNGGFENYVGVASTLGSSELGSGQIDTLGSINQWLYHGNMTIFGLGVADDINHSLRIGNALTDEVNDAYTQVTFSNAGTYEVTFDSFTDATKGATARAMVFLGSSSGSTVLDSQIFTEVHDGVSTSQSFTFTINEETVKKFNGNFTVGFKNANGDVEYNAPVMVDNVAVSQVPEPTSMMLGLIGFCGLILRRKRG